jgi:hypothetical protein
MYSRSSMRNGRLKQELENDGEDEWQHYLACEIGCRQQRKDEQTAEEYDFRIRRQRHFPGLFRRRHDVGVIRCHVQRCIDVRVFPIRLLFKSR